jgi:hypothetical protein
MQKMTSHIAVQNMKRISLQAGCEIKTEQILTTTGHTFFTEPEIIKWPFNRNVAGKLFDFDPLQLEEIVKKTLN